MAARRPSTGRRKIEIRRIESKPARQVCFSKRRTGLFSKASKLPVLCGAELAVVAFSTGGKAFSYGHPSVESVLGRFLPSDSPLAVEQAEVAVGSGSCDQNPVLEGLNQENAELRARLEAETARKDAREEALAKARAEGIQAAVWLDTDVWQMGEEELLAFAAALEGVEAAVAARADQVLQQAFLVGHTVHGGGANQVFQQMMMMPPPTWFAAGMEMVAPGFSAGMMIPPQTWFAAGMEMVAPGVAAGMMVPPQGFGPHGFPQWG